MVPGKRKDLVQAENSREVLLDMLDKGKIHGYKPADIDYFMGRGLADDLVADGSSGVWRNRRTPGQQVFFNPHFGIGHQWDWDNELARQIFDMNSRLGLSLRRELGAQALMPAIRQELRTSADAPATGDREGAADERTQTLIDQSIQSRAQTHQGFSPSAAIDAWLEPVALPAEEPTSDQSALPNNDELNELLPSAAAESVEMPAVAAEEAWGEPWMEPESSAAAGEATEVPPSPVPYSPQSLVSIREQRIAIAEAICVVNDYIADAQQAESHNRDAQDAATSLMERNTEQCDFAQSERDTVAGEQDRLTQAGDAQQQMTADNERASGEADRGQDEADTVKSKGQNVTVEPKPEEPRQRSWLERAWDATGGALWNNLIAPAVRVVRRKFNQVMNSINTFIMDMINQALGLDEIEKELNGGREDIAARDASLDETGAGLQETQDQAVAEEERNQQSVDQADANIADAVTTREDTQALMAELQAHDQVLLAEEMEGQAYVVDFGSRYEPFFAAEGATAAEGETVDVLAGVEPLATTTAPEPGTEESDETALT
jgi:hypothetical protein